MGFDLTPESVSCEWRNKRQDRTGSFSRREKAPQPRRSRLSADIAPRGNLPRRPLRILHAHHLCRPLDPSLLCVCVGLCVSHQAEGTVWAATLTDSVLYPPNPAGISCAPHSDELVNFEARETTRGPAHPGRPICGSSSFPTGTCYKWTAHQLVSEMGLGFHKPISLPQSRGGDLGAPESGHK